MRPPAFSATKDFAYLRCMWVPTPGLNLAANDHQLAITKSSICQSLLSIKHYSYSYDCIKISKFPVFQLLIGSENFQFACEIILGLSLPQKKIILFTLNKKSSSYSECEENKNTFPSYKKIFHGTKLNTLSVEMTNYKLKATKNGSLY